MKQISTIAIILLLSSIVFVSIGAALPFVQENDEPSAANKEATVVEKQFVPVDNMHHFMEYVCEPSYKGLKLALAAEPENRKAWKPFKNHALVLAETAALVAARAPDDDAAQAKQWRQISLEVHKSGTALYKSAGNYDEAKKHYGTMIDQCNQCHTVFAEGKHQLEK